MRLKREQPDATTASLTKMYGYVTTVAIAFEPTPIQKLSPTPSRSPSLLPDNTADLIRSKTPYVMAGLAVSTRPGRKPVHKPVTPDSRMMSWPVCSKVGALCFGCVDADDGVQSC